MKSRFIPWNRMAAVDSFFLFRNWERRFSFSENCFLDTKKTAPTISVVDFFSGTSAFARRLKNCFEKQTARRGKKSDRHRESDSHTMRLTRRRGLSFSSSIPAHPLHEHLLPLGNGDD